MEEVKNNCHLESGKGLISSQKLQTDLSTTSHKHTILKTTSQLMELAHRRSHYYSTSRVQICEVVHQPDSEY